MRLHRRTRALRGSKITGRTRPRAAKRNRRLALEPLEHRQMMTVAPFLGAMDIGNFEIGESWVTGPAVLSVSGGSTGDGYENDDAASRATTISTDGRPQTHSIHRAGDVDWVKFTLTERSEVAIETNGSSGDTRMWLYGPNSSSRQVAYNDDGGQNLFSRITRTGSNALEAGTYYVKVDEYGNNGTIGSYTISVRAESVGDVRDVVLVDTHFDVQRDGFSFANDGDVIEDSWWNGALNWALDSPEGICLGMASFAQQWFTAFGDPDHLWPVHLDQLEALGVAPYLAGIAQWTASLENIVPILTSLTGWVPNSVAQAGIVSDMIATGSPVVVGLQRSSGGAGHAVLATRIVERGSEMDIYVYDPNYPGNANRRITCDTATGSFTYGSYDRLTWFPEILPSVLT